MRVRFLLVRPRGPSGGILHVRGSAAAHASRIAAITFIALVLTPFTAPFPTYFLTDASSSHPCDALPKDIKDKIGSDDVACAPPVYLLVAPVVTGDVAVRAITRRPGDHPRRNLVLRL